MILALACDGLILAQTDSAPVGFNTIECLPGSDTYCSVPFVQKWEAQGLISGSPSVASGFATITPQGPVSWTTNQFATVYFVRMQSGVKAGMYYQISSNSSGTITFDLAGDNFSGVANGDSFAVSKFWTLSTLFPPVSQTTIVTSGSTLVMDRKTELLIPDLTGAGINLSPNRTFFITGGQWRESAPGFPAADDFILLPDTYFIVRHENSTITASTALNTMGTVELSAISVPLATLTSGPQDNATCTGRPISIQLIDLDLISSGSFVSSSGTLPADRRDELLVYDNGTAVVNRSPDAIFFYDSITSNWRESSTGFPVANSTAIPPGVGIVIRKHQTASGDTKFWMHNY